MGPWQTEELCDILFDKIKQGEDFHVLASAVSACGVRRAMPGKGSSPCRLSVWVWVWLVAVNARGRGGRGMGGQGG
jgi:hypothetical protein